jgi:hypothetical protein
MKRFGILCITVAIVGASPLALAGEGSSDGNSNAYGFGLALTIGEGMFFIHHDVYRGPVSLEVVPSFGWSWFKFDLGLATTLESVEIAGTDVGHWAFTFRPGGRLTPPMLPLYLRVAFPLMIHRHDFDWGMMVGLGADIRLVGALGLVLEADTAIHHHLNWGRDGMPLEFRAGVSLHF